MYTSMLQRIEDLTHRSLCFPVTSFFPKLSFILLSQTVKMYLKVNIIKADIYTLLSLIKKRFAADVYNVNLNKHKANIQKVPTSF